MKDSKTFGFWNELGLNSLSALSFNLHCVVQKPFVQRCFSLWYGFEFLGVVLLHGFLLLTYYNYIYVYYM